MMKKKLFTLLLTAGMLCGLAACQATENANAGVDTPAPTKEAEAPTTLPTKIPAPVAKTVSPLPVTIDMNHLDNCTVAVSFNKEDVSMNENGVMQLKVKVYTYDLYDMVDIATLAEGDTIILRGTEVPITSLVRTESGAVQINGGLDAGGYELITNENTVYFETGYSDIKTYFELGEAVLNVSDAFILIDNADPESDAKTFTFEDLTSDKVAYIYGFSPYNTSIVIENGVVTQMKRIYTP